MKRHLNASHVKSLLGRPCKRSLRSRQLSPTSRKPSIPKAPCTSIVDTYALKGSLYKYFKAKAYTIKVRGALGNAGAALLAEKWGPRAREGRFGFIRMIKGYEVFEGCRVQAFGILWFRTSGLSGYIYALPLGFSVSGVWLLFSIGIDLGIRHVCVFR